MNAPTPTPATPQPRPAAKHTPGPWNPIQAPQDCGAYWWIQSPADIEGCRDLATLSRHFSTEANAKLIASAPELLRELKNCVAAIQKWGKEHPESGGWMGVISGGLKAISQAEGGAQ